VVDPSGPECYCGARGCWESLASGPAIARQARELLDDYPGSELLQLADSDPEKIDARQVAEAAQAGDPLGKAVIAKAAHYLSLGLINIVMLFTPELIVLSGGVMRSADLLLPAIQEAMQTIDVIVPAGQVRVTLAELGYYAGMYGGAYTVMRRGGEGME
jgi:glucokinase